MATNTSRALADYVLGTRSEPLPADARRAALHCVLDLVTAAAAGYSSPGVRAVLQMVLGEYGDGSAEIWFTGHRASVSGAVFCNSAAASALDLDDGFRLARGHPGAASIPAAIAALSEVDATADELLTAIVAGYEIGVRVAMGRLQYSPSGTWSPYAAIAAAGCLRRSSAEHLAQAFAIAAQCGPALPGLAGLMGSDVKEGIPWGASTGIAALRLAEAGYTGPRDIFDDPKLFSSQRMLEDLGESPLIGRTYFKPYACCRHIHAPLDAFRALMDSHSLMATEIESVQVHTYSATFNLSNRTDPRDLVDVQYSVPYCIGVLALRGPLAFLPLDDSVLDASDVRHFAARVTVHLDPALDRMFPEKSPARVVLTTSKGRFESPVTCPRGDPDAPLSRVELEDKFRTATRRTLSLARQDALLAAIGGLERGDPLPLRAALASA